MKRPAFQFYPGDWRRDAALRSCSIAARGLWADLLCLMHDGEPYGHLSVNSHPLSDAQAASMVGVTPAQYRKLLGELESAGVSSRSESGVLYSRRMVRDEHIRNVRAESGKKGGNPALLVNQPDNQTTKQIEKQNLTPASASASASANESSPSPARDAARMSGAWAKLHDRLPPTGPYRGTVTEFLTSLPDSNVVGWASTLLNYLEGIGAPGGRPVTPDELLVSLARMQAAKADERADPRFFAGIMRSLAADRHRAKDPAAAPAPQKRLPRLAIPEEAAS